MVALFALFAIQMSPAAVVDAQQVPTSTPADPLTQAFNAVRAALEEKYSTDLSIVQRWTFEEANFANGITSCVDLGEDESPISLYWGWRFVITSLSGLRMEGRTSFDRTIVVACDRVEVSAAPTAVPAANNPNLPAPIAGAGAGGGFELGGHVLDLSSGTIGLMQRSHMSWVKRQFRYTLGQDASAVAGLIQQAHASGFKILLGIVGDQNQLAANFDSYIASYASFVGGVA
ncbi:MAG: hypothetical protein U0670_06435, partial [Anaerolineae bacterium]